MTLFERIKELSKSKDKSLQDIALELGFSINIFYKWKNSEPKARDLEKVADYFDVSVDYLLGRTENMHGIVDDKQRALSVEEAINSVMSYDGEPLTDNDREIIRGIVEAYLDKK